MSKSDSGIIRVHVKELRIGMCVCHLETLTGESPFMFDRIDIGTQADIQAIQAVCDYVHINVKWQKDYTGAIPTRNTGAIQHLSFARSFNQTAATFQKTSNLIKTVMDDVRFGNQFSVTEVKRAVSDCVDKVLENSDAMLLLTQLKDQDLYTAQHSMNVCVLSILLGRELNYSVDELNKIGFCGLMHDIGKMKVPLEILNFPGKLEGDELELMRKHTTFGRDVLMSARNIYLGAVDVAYAHHEKITGGGYPRGIAVSGLTEHTRIVTVVDAYDAITSDRVYQRGQTHLEALGVLVKGMKTQFEANFVTQFINSIGFYPQGNLVELSSGEFGIIVEQNPGDRLKPKVLIILDELAQSQPEKILDLCLGSQDKNGQVYKVKRIVRAKDYGVDLLRFLEDGKFTKKYPTVT